MSGEEYPRSFLNRWSNRKREQQHDALISEDKLGSEPLLDAGLHDSAPQQLEQAEPVGLNPNGVAELSVPVQEPVLTDADMPSVESLDGSSDVSAFFSKGVSAALRKAALRQVFKQPEFNVRDGLNDYDGDYTVFEPLGDTITADMKFHIARKERDRLAAEEAAEEISDQEEPATEQSAEQQGHVNSSETEAAELDDESVVEEAEQNDDLSIEAAQSESVEASESSDQNTIEKTV